MGKGKYKCFMQPTFTTKYDLSKYLLKKILLLRKGKKYIVGNRNKLTNYINPPIERKRKISTNQRKLKFYNPLVGRQM